MRHQRVVQPIWRALAVAAALSQVTAVPAFAESIVVGSKNFAENRLIAEMFAQLIEEHTELEVERRLGLAGTDIAFAALTSGAVDLYPEYTGTGLVSILGEGTGAGTTAPLDAAETLAVVRQEFRQRWDLLWLAPLGFENSYEIAVRREWAERNGVRTLSALVPYAADLKGGFGFEFLERADGLPGLQATYDLQLGDTRSLQQALKYRAVESGEIDVLDVYTTDGRLALSDLLILEDDRRFFPPYQAAALVRRQTLAEHPGIAEALGLLSGLLDADRMQALNHRLQDLQEDEAFVARQALAELGLLESGEEIESRASSLRWLAAREIAQRTWEHLLLTLTALAAGVLVAVPLGLWLERHRRLAEIAIRLLGTTQTVPSIALLAFAVPLLGVGWLPALVALWIYSLFPIVRNTYSGVSETDPEIVEAARAVGMTNSQILRQIRLPLAAPILMAGIRTAAVITIGTATLAAFIGAGGLGVPIVTGLQLADSGRILSGALPAAALAVAVDLFLGRLEQAVRPAGIGK